MCDEIEVIGCTNPDACNYDENPTTDSDENLCTYPDETYLNCEGDCLNDSDGDSVCDEIEVIGCTNPDACNYDENPTTDSDENLCTYPDETYLNCEGDCLNDSDGDGVCDEIEVEGCTSPDACNYDEIATDDNDSCTYPDETYLDCNSECLNDSDNDGVCDEIEIGGCTSHLRVIMMKLQQTIMALVHIQSKII